MFFCQVPLMARVIPIPWEAKTLPATNTSDSFLPNSVGAASMAICLDFNGVCRNGKCRFLFTKYCLQREEIHLIELQSYLWFGRIAVLIHTKCKANLLIGAISSPKPYPSVFSDPSVHSWQSLHTDSKMAEAFKCVVCSRNRACTCSCLCVSRACALKFEYLNEDEKTRVEEIYGQLRQTYSNAKAKYVKERYNTVNKTPIVKRPEVRAMFKASKPAMKTSTIERVKELGSKVQKRIQMVKEQTKQMDELCAAFERLSIS